MQESSPTGSAYLYSKEFKILWFLSFYTHLLKK